MTPLHYLSNIKVQTFKGNSFDLMFMLFPILESGCILLFRAEVVRRKTCVVEEALLSVAESKTNTHNRKHTDNLEKNYTM